MAFHTAAPVTVPSRAPNCEPLYPPALSPTIAPNTPPMAAPACTAAGLPCIPDGEQAESKAVGMHKMNIIFLIPQVVYNLYQTDKYTFSY